MEANGVLAAAYDQANNRLTLTAVTGTATRSTSSYEPNWIWSHVWDGTGIRVIRVG